MSILINGMEMPESCHECRLYEGDIYYCSAADKMIDISDSSAEKCQFCPLVPVPLHGRLGDLDALEKILKEKQAQYKARDLLATHELSEAMRMGFDAAVGHVLMAPTIIPAEERD